MTKIIVTRHRALVQYLMKHGYVPEDTEHVTFANPDQIAGKHVYGVLPNWLACHAGMLTEVQLRLPPDKRTVELTIDEVEFYAREPQTFIIKEVKNGTSPTVSDGR